MRSDSALRCRGFILVFMAARLALALLVLAPTVAAAEGERTPMIGGSVVGAAAHEDALGGVGLDMTWWAWRAGLSVEGTMLWRADSSAERVAVVGVGLRLLAYDTLVESWLEPRNVELGIELQGIAERWLWNDDWSTPTRYGIGVAVRLRGGSDYDLSSLLAESRVFLRVTKTPQSAEAIGRTVGPAMTEHDPITIMIGVGASWGSGKPDYLDKFRMEPFSPPARRLAGDWLGDR
jgi:hypothetical protein